MTSTETNDNPDDAAGWCQRGVSHLQAERYDAAVDDLTHAIRLDPSSADAFAYRGIARHRLREYDAALADLDEAVHLHPSDADLYYYRGGAYLGLRDYDAAVAEYTAALPQSRAYRGRARAFLRLNDLDAALADLDEALRLTPRDAEALSLRAEVYLTSERPEAAIGDYSEAIKLLPDDAALHQARAHALDALGEPAAADADYDAATNLQYQRDDMTRTLLQPLLQSHFQPAALESVVITERRFPLRIKADLQRAVDDLVATMTLHHFGGVRKAHSHDGPNLTDLLVRDHDDVALSVPPQYEEIDIGEETHVRCLKSGLWLLELDGSRLAVFLKPPSPYRSDPQVVFQVAAVNDAAGAAVSNTFFRHLEEAVRQGRSYRGKILSLEWHENYGGASTGIKVHKLRAVARDQVILPPATLDLLDRNVIEFVRRRPRLARAGMATKKGLLFYGPPGTGKTHTIHYLTRALPGTTTLLIAAEQVGLLGEYMTLARLLQPSLVVIEDADLIARERSEMNSPCEEVLLNKLLNEMDGLREDADILFILTTNRPEALEAALASRPGRVDQAIEFPFPDAAGREKLIRLYARSVPVSAEVVRATVARTQNVSAAFLKELMRRAAQFQMEREESDDLSLADVDSALDELLFKGGSLNRKLLGGQVEEGDDYVSRER